MRTGIHAFLVGRLFRPTYFNVAAWLNFYVRSHLINLFEVCQYDPNVFHTFWPRPDSRGTFSCLPKRKYPKRRAPGNLLEFPIPIPSQKIQIRHSLTRSQNHCVFHPTCPARALRVLATLSKASYPLKEKLAMILI